MIHAPSATARKRAAGARAKRERKRVGSHKPGKPLRDPKYREWIRSLPCVICWVLGTDWDRHKQFTGAFLIVQGEAVLDFTDHSGNGNRPRPEQSSPTECAHSGSHGISQKAGDDTCLPLCKLHHTEGRDSYHRMGVRFFEHHGLDRVAILSDLRARYEESRAA